MQDSFELTILFTLALVAGIAAQVLANFVKVPSIVFLLLFGLLLGPDGLGWVHPQVMGSGLEALVSLAVALILFEGGLNLRLQRLNQVSDSLRNLVLLGSLLTLVGGAAAAHYLGEFPWRLAFLFGSLVVVTGPTVINPILKRVRVDPAVSTLLEGEGVLIDPIGAILAVVVLQVVLSGHPSFLMALEQLSSRLAIGSAVGALGGWLMGSFLLWSRQFLTEELRNSVVLAGALGVFALAQSLRSEAGLMAVVMAGLVVRQKAAIAERGVRQFHGQLVVLAISVIFILLTATLSLKAVFALGWGSLATVLCLMLVIRPLSVWLCTWRSDLNWRQKLFVAWLAPRGIVAASVASLFAILLTERGITGGGCPQGAGVFDDLGDGDGTGVDGSLGGPLAGSGSGQFHRNHRRSSPHQPIGPVDALAEPDSRGDPTAFWGFQKWVWQLRSFPFSGRQRPRFAEASCRHRVRDAEQQWCRATWQWHPQT